MNYRIFDTRKLQDPWFESLPPQGKLLFIYLWTNEICNQTGMCQISKKRTEFEGGKMLYLKKGDQGERKILELDALYISGGRGDGVFLKEKNGEGFLFIQWKKF